MSQMRKRHEFNSISNVVGEGKNAGYKHFLSFPPPPPMFLTLFQTNSDFYVCTVLVL